MKQTIFIKTINDCEKTRLRYILDKYFLYRGGSNLFESNNTLYFSIYLKTLNYYIFNDYILLGNSKLVFKITYSEFIKTYFEVMNTNLNIRKIL